MTQIVKSRWRYAERTSRITTFLDALTIEYRTVAGQTFFEANREHLRTIYRQVKDEAREVYRELHPDMGGDAREFDNFVQAYAAFKKRFVREGFQNTAEPEHNEDVFIPAGLLRDPKRALEMARHIKGGLTNRKIARLMRATPASVARVRKHLNVEVMCGCGRRVGHKGICRAMMPNHPKFVEHLKRQPGPKNRLKPKSEAERRSISAGLKGKPKSRQHVERIVMSRVVNDTYKQSPATRAKQQNTMRELRAKQRASGTLPKHSAETKEKLRRAALQRERRKRERKMMDEEAAA